MLATLVAALGLAAGPANAGAESFGQIGSGWGSIPTFPVEDSRSATSLYLPSAFGVDPVDDDVYVLDSNAAQTEYRLQSFTASGTPLASAAIPRPETGTVTGQTRAVLDGIAVDHSLNRIYLVQSTAGLDAEKGSLTFVAEKLLVYSADTLTPASGFPGGITLPSLASGKALENTGAVLPPAVDPTTHDVLFSAGAEGTGTTFVPVVARFNSSGTEIGRFTDSGAKVNVSGRGEIGLVVAPDGQSVYLGMGSTNQFFEAYKLPSDLSGIVKLDGTGGNPKLKSVVKESGSEGQHITGYGPQIALSPDGSILYFTEKSKATANPPTSPGEYWIRGLSTADGSSRVLYGGAASAPCAITYRSAPLVTDSGGSLFTLDRGNFEQSPPTFGDKVYKLGAGGEGCPGPVAVLKLGGSSQSTVTVQKGSSVALDSTATELKTRILTESIWKWSGPESGGETLKETSGVPPSLTFSRRFLKAGTYTVNFNMTVKTTPTPNYGASWSATPKTLVVEAATPVARFTPSTTNASSGAPVGFNAEASEDPTGGECTQAEGCKPSTGAEPGGLKTYHWDFGDGATENTTSPTTQHTFVNTSGATAEPTVKLTVTSNDEVVSSAVSHQIAVATQAVPAVTTSAASGIGKTAVTLNGSVDPKGSTVTDCHFEYGPTTSYGSSAPCVPSPGSGNGAVGVSAAVGSLAPDTTYHFKLVATNAGGSGEGGDLEVTTLDRNKPVVAAAAPDEVAQTSAKALGTVNPNGFEVTACHFEYGPTTSYGSSAPCVPASIGSGTTAVAVSASLTGLSANTTYHYRVTATSSEGTTEGNDQAFTTKPNVPTVTTTAGASPLAQTTATLAGTVNPNGGNVTKCEVEYGPTTSYGSKASCASLPGSGTSAVAVSASLTGLSANTTYHFRFVAENPGGPSNGGDQEFKTLPLKPTIANEPVESVSQTSAALAGMVNNNGATAGTTCSFEVALASDPSFTTPVAMPECTPKTIMGSTATEVFASVTGLTPGTAYLYRVKGTNAGGTTLGAPVTSFTTSPTEQSGGGGSGGSGGGAGGTSGGSGSGSTGGSGGGGSTGGGSVNKSQQKRRAALRKCRKLHGKARAKCVKKANKLGKPKPRRNLQRAWLPASLGW